MANLLTHHKISMEINLLLVIQHKDNQVVMAIIQLKDSQVVMAIIKLLIKVIQLKDNQVVMEIIQQVVILDPKICSLLVRDSLFKVTTMCILLHKSVIQFTVACLFQINP